MSRDRPPPIGRVLLSDEQLDLDASHELPPQRGGLLWGRVMNILNSSTPLDPIVPTEEKPPVPALFARLGRA
jgi:hypothetical protein